MVDLSCRGPGVSREGTPLKRPSVPEVSKYRRGLGKPSPVVEGGHGLGSTVRERRQKRRDILDRLVFGPTQKFEESYRNLRE